MDNSRSYFSPRKYMIECVYVLVFVSAFNVLHKCACIYALEKCIGKKYFVLLEKKHKLGTQNIVIFVDTVVCPNIFFAEK